MGHILKMSFFDCELFIVVYPILVLKEAKIKILNQLSKRKKRKVANNCKFAGKVFISPEKVKSQC